MEYISIQVPASLYTSIFEHHGEETTGVIVTCLSQLLGDEKTVKPRVDSTMVSYPRPGDGTITGRIWDIADNIQMQSGNANRVAVIEACMSEGININTASTQFSYWRKANETKM